MSNGQLKAFVERIERLEEEKKALAEDIREVFSEAKAQNFNIKAMREILKRRKMDIGDRTELELQVDEYMMQLNMTFEGAGE